jgi:hypothetical protein
MIRIETSVRRDQVIFAVIGRIESNDLPELKRVIESHDPPVILDLKAVRLVDRDGVTFPDDCRICEGHLEREAMSGGVRTIKQKFEIGNPKKIHMLKKKTPKFATEPRSKK